MNAGTFEKRLQLALTLAVGAGAAVFSWAHSLDFSRHNGTSGLLAWVPPLCIETLAVCALLELRRRLRVGDGRAFPIALLVAATAVQIGVQVAEAEKTLGGIVVGVSPAASFLLLFKMALGWSKQAAPAAVRKRAQRRMGEGVTEAASAAPQPSVHTEPSESQVAQEPHESQVSVESKDSVEQEARAATEADLGQVVRPIVERGGGRPEARKALTAARLKCSNNRLARYVDAVKAEQANVVPIRAAAG